MDLASLTLLNGGSPQVAFPTQQGDAVCVTASPQSGPGGVAQIRALVMAGTSEVIALARPLGAGASSVNMGGVVVYSTGSQAAVTLCVVNVASGSFYAASGARWTSLQQRASFTDQRGNLYGMPLYQRILVVGGVSAQCYLGPTPNGPWLLVDTYNNFTAQPVDRVGIWANSETDNAQIYFEHLQGS